jgi:AraC-like DNA-binding protein
MDYSLYFFSIGSFLFIGFALHLLFTKNGNTYLNRLLAVILLFRGLKMLYYIFVATNQKYFVSFFFNSFDPLYFAYPACIYLYIRGFINNENRFKKSDWFHFIPVLFAIINIISWYFLDASKRDAIILDVIAKKTLYIDEDYGFFSNAITFFLRNLLIILYLIFSWKLFLKSEFIKNRKENIISYNWVLFLLIIMSFTNFNFFITSIVNIASGGKSDALLFYNYIIILLCAIILVVIIFVFYNPKITYRYVFVSKEPFLQEQVFVESTELLIPDNLEISDAVDKKKRISINDFDIENYKSKILFYMTEEKPYLRSDFTLNDLAQHIGLPLHQCSHFVNCEFGENFRDWINGYRITFFIEEYPKKSAKNTILSVALDCGFNNKVTSYNSFKKMKGVTPTEYFNS